MPEQEEKKKKEDSNQSKATNVQDSTKKKKKRSRQKDIDLSELTPMLVAAKNGITEMVNATLKRYPMAMYDVDKNQKNVVLLTAEHKQPCVYKLLLSLKEEEIIKESIFYEVDDEGNSALHLAAKKINFDWPVPGAASQMQWEIKLYEFIKNSMQGRYIPLRNKNGQTSEEIFTESHKDLVTKGGNWLTSISNAGMVVAGILVTVTLTMSTTVLDSAKEGNKHEKPSKLFAGSSFVSFYTSLLAVAMFLSIATPRYRRRDFRFSLLGKLLVGLTALYASIVSTLISFAIGFFFIFRDQLLSAAISYVLACLLLIIFFSLAQFPLYFHLVWATFKKVPTRNYSTE